MLLSDHASAYDFRALHEAGKSMGLGGFRCADLSRFASNTVIIVLWRSGGCTSRAGFQEGLAETEAGQNMGATPPVEGPHLPVEQSSWHRAVTVQPNPLNRLLPK